MQKSLTIRITLVCLWIAFIFCLLYSPAFFESKESKKVLNIFCWSDLFDDETIHNFENETGIKIHFNYYETNEEMLVKVKATKGQGQDLIVPSDYATKILIESELLKPLNSSLIDFKERIHPKLLCHAYDPQNTYSFPLSWEVFGLTYDKDHFGATLKDPSWSHIFSPKDHTVAMVDDPIEALNLSAFYLLGKQAALTPSQTSLTRETLTTQKRFVEAYGNYRVAYLIATKNCPLAVTPSSYNFRMVKDYPSIGFALPNEGSFITIENIAIPIGCENEEAAYAFLNYIYRQDNMQRRCQTFAQFPPTPDSLPDLHPAYTETYHTTLDHFTDFAFFRHLVPEQTMRDIWVDVKH